ncbi:nuclear transport factor 2 family protein [Ferrimonas marina]|nr:nuclear transport factor 2 family protein [Ferrimonas marina]
MATTAPMADENLFEQIKAQDQRFFDAFNACDIDTMAQMFSPWLEFYHDLSGLSDFEQTMQATRNNCQRNLGLERTLIEGSLKVYPVKELGAIQTGKHRFCHPVEGTMDCGTFEFLHIWKRDGEQWKIHRVVSYGH